MKPKSIKSIRFTQVLLSFALAAIAAPALDFSTVAAVTIPEGAVESISTLDGEVLWKRLPYDAEVEWIGSDGTQYIDTGVAAGSDIGCDMWMSTPATGQTFGVLRRISSTYDRYHIGVYAGTTDFYLGRGTVVAVQAPSVLGPTLRRFRVDEVNRTASIDSTTASWSGVAAFSTALNIFFPLRNDNGASVTSYSCRFGACRISRAGVLVRDFIPVRVGSVGYLYDRVSGELYRNQGTGAFAVGPDKTN